ncbi:uncharacterized protein LOC121999210 [Zingiber officinale]|uniref:uncharacterized protein LOC121999210 n=1 Tax=Zingiber officinale TaxID=94328 RepID=UPI001C4CC95C|nr:uncharacterized protein LOC121999210 [Zingiber officinale]
MTIVEFYISMEDYVFLSRTLFRRTCYEKHTDLDSRFIQEIKAEHQRLAGLLQKIEILEWKWKHITMDFVVGLLRTRKGHDAIWMEPFEALYDRACRSPTLWDEVGESLVLGLQRIQRDAELVNTIRRRMSEAQDLQKSYADQRWRPLEFSVDDHVFLQVSPTKGVRRFGLKGKLGPHYIGPFQIHERIGEVAYRLALPPSLAWVHDVFHVSMLRKYVPHPMHILTYVPITLQPDVTYEEVLVRILDRSIGALFVDLGSRYHQRTYAGDFTFGQRIVRGKLCGRIKLWVLDTGEDESVSVIVCV